MKIRGKSFDFSTLAQSDQICDLLGIKRVGKPFELNAVEQLYKENIGSDYKIVESKNYLFEKSYHAQNGRFKTTSRPCKAQAIAGLLIQELSKRIQE